MPNQEAFTQLDFGSRFQGPPSTLRKVHPETVVELDPFNLLTGLVDAQKSRTFI